MRKLNLGAGNAPMADAVNHDRAKHRAEIDVAWDLNVLPWPWGDGSFDLIIALSVFEHLTLDLVQSMDECWRILAKGGQIALKVPMWNCEAAYRDPTHRWRFSPQTIDLFDPDTEYGKQYGFYTARKWRIVVPVEVSRGGTAIHATLEVRK
jgi:SAM-dependent methyltransferase